MGYEWQAVYTETFESITAWDYMKDNGWTWYQYGVEGADTDFVVYPGNYGQIDCSVLNWPGGFELDAGAAWTKYRVEFDIVSYVSGRWIFGFRSSAAGVYWVQGLPGSQLHLMKGTRTHPTGAVVIQNWDAQDPGAPHTKVKIEVDGSSIKLWVNDVYIGEHIDASFSTGSIAISGYQNGWMVDNIVVSEYVLVADPTPPTESRDELRDVKISWDTNAMEGTIEFRGIINDLKEDAGLSTAVLISLFTDARAREDDELPDVLLPEDFPNRRGWWGDSTSERDNDSVGSRLWLLDRSKDINENLRLAEEYAEESLQWMIDEGIAAKVKCVAESIVRLGEGNVLALDVQITKATNETLSFKFETLWEETV